MSLPLQLARRLIGRFQRMRHSRILLQFGQHSSMPLSTHLVGCEGISIGNDVHIRPFSKLEAIRKPPYRGQIIIGDRTTAQWFLHIGAAELVEIGSDVLIAGSVYISDHDHDFPLENSSELVVSPVKIGDRCWLGEKCSVLKGVTLGSDCLVAAHAVVTKSFPSGSVVAGVPARLIRTLGTSS